MSQLSELQEYETHLKQSLEYGDALNKLLDNKLFKKVILQGYLQDEAIRLVQLKADMQWQSPERQAYLDKAIAAVGGFNEFILFKQKEHQQIKQALENTSTEIANVLNEGEDENE